LRHRKSTQRKFVVDKEKIGKRRTGTNVGGIGQRKAGRCSRKGERKFAKKKDLLQKKGKVWSAISTNRCRLMRRRVGWGGARRWL